MSEDRQYEQAFHREFDWAFDKLKAPFHPDQIHWRVGATTKDKKKGMALAYLDARDVMDRLDDVVGPNNWSANYSAVNGVTVCYLTLYMPRCTTTGYREEVCKADGAGATDVEGEKGAMSDAFKRSAVKFGIGRYLYRLESKWVDLNDRGYIIKPPSLPEWALPTDVKVAKTFSALGSSESTGTPDPAKDTANFMVHPLLQIRKDYGDGAEHMIEGFCNYWDIPYKPMGFVDFSIIKKESLPEADKHIRKIKEKIDAED